MDFPQKFEFGYHLNSWDFKGKAEEGIAFLVKMGFRWFEALVLDSLDKDFFRRYGGDLNPGIPFILRDIDIFHRLGLFSRAQAEYGLRVSSLYANASFINPNLWEFERDMIHGIARFVKGCGSDILVMGGGPPESHYPHTKEDYQNFTRKLEEVGHFCNSIGIKLAYHPHLACFIETRKQLDIFMDMVNMDLVGLCIDPAHFQVNGSDPVDILQTYVKAVRYLHFKDCKGDLAKLRFRSFCPLGEGVVDLRSLANILLQNGYDGRIIMELDIVDDADAGCRQNVDYVTKTLGLNLTVS